MENDDLQRRRTYGVYSDLFKDLHGIRPRWASDWSEERLLAAIDEVCDELQAEADTTVEREWLTLELDGPLDFQDF